jgi:hypothetical protein
MLPSLRRTQLLGKVLMHMGKCEVRSACLATQWLKLQLRLQPPKNAHQSPASALARQTTNHKRRECFLTMIQLS